MNNNNQNQKSDSNDSDWDVTRWSDPNFRRERGIEPVVVNPNEPDATQKITEALENLFRGKKDE